MKITLIRYRRLQSHDRGYGHDAVEAEAQVDEGEDAGAALETLKAWVLHRLDGIREIDRHLDTLETLRGQVVSEERRLNGLRADIKRDRELLKKHETLADLAREHGLDLGGDELSADVPF